MTAAVNPLLCRAASPADLPAIVRMLHDDELGAQREKLTGPQPTSYRDAFARIEKFGGGESGFVEQLLSWTNWLRGATHLQQQVLWKGTALAVPPKPLNDGL